MQGWSSQFQDATTANPKWLSEGPLAHQVEQGTFNPKVPGSSPGRPTISAVQEANCRTRPAVRPNMHPTMRTSWMCGARHNSPDGVHGALGRRELADSLRRGIDKFAGSA